MDIDNGVTIVIPAYNEARRLPGTLDRLFSEPSGFGARELEVVVSDDGSTDGTAEVARAFGGDRVKVVRDQRHRGKGAALMAGISEARHPTVVFLDADLPVPVETIEHMVGELVRRRSVDLLVGSRRLPGAAFDPPQPLTRRLGGRAFLAVTRGLGYRTTTDPQCGVKVLRRRALEPVLAEVTSAGFAFDIELIVRSRIAGLGVDEVPVTWTHVPGSSLRPVRDAVSTLTELARLRPTLAGAARP